MLFTWTETKPSMWQNLKCLYFGKCEPISKYPTLMSKIQNELIEFVSSYTMACVIGVLLVVVPVSILFFKPQIISAFQRLREPQTEEPIEKTEPSRSVGDTRPDVAVPFKRPPGRPTGVAVYPPEVYQILGSSGCGLDHQGDFQNDEEEDAE
ncbi:hypothetical protein J6590_067553 [Homalodisca vitripennis]|nr:hypothetical protein J6590_067553 [Homalodisca vitripennis]